MRVDNDADDDDYVYVCIYDSAGYVTDIPNSFSPCNFRQKHYSTVVFLSFDFILHLTIESLS